MSIKEEVLKEKKRGYRRKWNHSKKGIACKKKWDKEHKEYYANWRKKNKGYQARWLNNKFLKIEEETKQKMIEEFKEMIDKIKVWEPCGDGHSQKKLADKFKKELKKEVEK